MSVEAAVPLRTTRSLPRCEECGRLILGAADGGAGASVALVTTPRQTGRKVLFTQRTGLFHARCLRARVHYHHHRARRLLAGVAIATCSTATLSLALGGSPALALLVAALGGYAAYLEAQDVRALA